MNWFSYRFDGSSDESYIIYAYCLYTLEKYEMSRLCTHTQTVESRAVSAWAESIKRQGKNKSKTTQMNEKHVKQT